MTVISWVQHSEPHNEHICRNTLCHRANHRGFECRENTSLGVPFPFWLGVGSGQKQWSVYRRSSTKLAPLTPAGPASLIEFLGKSVKFSRRKILLRSGGIFEDSSKERGWEWWNLLQTGKSLQDSTYFSPFSQWIGSRSQGASEDSPSRGMILRISSRVI